MATMREIRTPVGRGAPRCRRCGMPCVKVVSYTRCAEAVDVLLLGDYCSDECLLWCRDDAMKLVPKKSAKRKRWLRGETE
jgi:hypothetical protein